MIYWSWQHLTVKYLNETVHWSQCADSIFNDHPTRRLFLCFTIFVALLLSCPTAFYHHITRQFIVRPVLYWNKDLFICSFICSSFFCPSSLPSEFSYIKIFHIWSWTYDAMENGGIAWFHKWDYIIFLSFLCKHDALIFHANISAPIQQHFIPISWNYLSALLESLH